MPTPVIIPAHNEANFLDRTLGHMPKDCDPIVIANGCTDRTPAITRSFGATLIELSDKSKTRAFQQGLRHLGRRATEPMLLLDADTYPLSRHWPQAMCASFESAGSPQCAVGPVVYTGGVSRAANIVRTAKRYLINSRAYLQGTTRPCGQNMALRLDEKTLEAMLGMDDYWPGEDVAIRDIVINNGGTEHGILNPLALVLTDSARAKGLIHRLREGRAETKREMYGSYIEDAPPGSIPYVK